MLFRSIDGPSGSGKGTVAGILAKRLGWNLLDSGALYHLLRAIIWPMTSINAMLATYSRVAKPKAWKVLKVSVST